MTSPRLNRNDLQRLADIRIAEARTLLDSGHYSGAYYLTGYAVKCALKAYIAKQVREFDFPDRNLAIRSYSHKLQYLLKTALLDTALEQEGKSNPPLLSNWLVVQSWNVESRYKPDVSQDECRGLYTAVTDSANGILLWVKLHW